MGNYHFDTLGQPFWLATFTGSTPRSVIPSQSLSPASICINILRIQALELIDLLHEIYKLD